MERIRQGWEAFQPYLDGDTPPPLSAADTVLREDADWLQAAAAYTRAKQAADTASKALDQARDGLVALADHPREYGASVAVTRFWKSGNVDYKQIPALRGLDLAAYRGAVREEVRVTVDEVGEDARQAFIARAYSLPSNVRSQKV